MTVRMTLLCVGSLKEAYWRSAVSEYSKRLRPFAALSVVEVPESRLPARASAAQERAVVEAESKALLAKIARTPRSYVIALDARGRQLSSPALSEWMSKQLSAGRSEFIFVIGGSLGLSDELLARADCCLSFSELTFPHQMMRVMLLEQLYRAMKIRQNEPYHK